MTRRRNVCTHGCYSYWERNAQRNLEMNANVYGTLQAGVFSRRERNGTIETRRANSQLPRALVNVIVTACRALAQCSPACVCAPSALWTLEPCVKNTYGANADANEQYVWSCVRWTAVYMAANLKSFSFVERCERRWSEHERSRSSQERVNKW